MLMNEENTQRRRPPVCLTIAGLDPSGGAGVVADVKTFTAFGCFAAAAVTSLTFQNTTAVFGAVHQTAATVRGQVEPVLQDFDVAALKTGMLPTREVIGAVAALVRENGLKNFVVDPVVRSTSGFDLIDDAALTALIEKLFPLSDLVTPNVPEAERIARMKIADEKDVRRAAAVMQSFGAKAVLIKGGHLFPEKEKERAAGGAPKARDYLFAAGREEIFEAEFIETRATHGTGCALAAAVAANLARGKSLTEAVAAAKQFVTEAIRTAPLIGAGHSPINTAPRREDSGPA